MWCRRWDSNPRPRDYETLALPLSYTGTSSNDGTECLGIVSSQREGGFTVFLDETPDGILRCGSTVVLLTDPVAPDTLHRVFGYQALGYGAGSRGVYRLDTKPSPVSC